jgi:hypothetical protein
MADSAQGQGEPSTLSMIYGRSFESLKGYLMKPKQMSLSPTDLPELQEHHGPANNRNRTWRAPLGREYISEVCDD